MIHCVGIALLVLGFVVLFWLKAQIEHRPAVHTYGFGDGDVFPWYLFVVVGAIIGVPLILAVRRLRRARRALERAGTTSA